jgi:cysteinyl-tRNA synthetase
MCLSFYISGLERKPSARMVAMPGEAAEDWRCRTSGQGIMRRHTKSQFQEKPELRYAKNLIRTSFFRGTMALQIFNTMTHKKETFVPLNAGKVSMYVCGPTVYSLLHVGNFRGPIFYNLARNWLEASGYKVDFAYNFTDVDDKIITRANTEKTTSEAISEKYIGEFKKDFNALKLRAHTHNPKVTDSIQPIIELVGELIKNQKAYVAADGEVLYSVRSFDGYGKLSNRNLDDLEAGARVQIDPKKRDPMDFSLWKPAKPGEPKWASPWCDGRPGWHIECSAMVKSIFGETIDIHGGGTDLVFPHHENEIAQSEGASGKTFAKIWMHNNMITFGDKKMSKSVGNIMTAREFLEKFDGEILKFMMLSVHYRSLSDFSTQAVHIAIASLAKIYSALCLADKMLAEAKAQGVSVGKVAVSLADALAGAEKHAVEALNDDFNTPELMASLYSVIKAFNSSVRLGAKVAPEGLANASAFHEWVLSKGKLLSLFEESPVEYLRRLDDRLLMEKALERSKIDQMVLERSTARQNKDFKKSDELRDALLNLGIAIQDSPTGTTWEVAKS